MNFLREHFEKLILACFVLGVFAVLFVTAGYLNQLRKKERSQLEFTMAGDTLERVSEQDFTASRLLNTDDLRWKSAEKHAKRLISPARFMWCANQECRFWLPYDVEVCPYCGETQSEKDEDERVVRKGQDLDDDGIDDKTENQYDFLSPENPDDADKDYDGDWFSNKVEINSETDPADKQDHPPLATRLALVGVKRRLFPAVLKSGGDTVQINTYRRDGSRSHFLSEGEKFPIYFGREQRSYTLKDIRTKTVKKEVPWSSDSIEESVAAVKVQYKDQKPIVLVQNKKKYVGKKVGFRFYPNVTEPDNSELYSVTAEEPLVIEGPAETEETYEVQVKSKEAVTLRRKKTGETFEVTTSTEFLKETEREEPEKPEGEGQWKGMEESVPDNL